jgi:hypothetical protein
LTLPDFVRPVIQHFGSRKTKGSPVATDPESIPPVAHRLEAGKMCASSPPSMTRVPRRADWARLPREIADQIFQYLLYLPSIDPQIAHTSPYYATYYYSYTGTACHTVLRYMLVCRTHHWLIVSFYVVARVHRRLTIFCRFLARISRRRRHQVERCCRYSSCFARAIVSKSPATLFQPHLLQCTCCPIGPFCAAHYDTGTRLMHVDADRGL